MANTGLFPAQVRRITLRGQRPIALTPDSLVVHQAEFAHEVISVLIERREDASPVFQTGVPVEIEWGLESGEAQTFYGYVNHPEPMSQQGIGKAQRLRLICIGASVVMKEPRQRAWRNARVSNIAVDLIDKQKFSARVQSSPQIWPTLVQEESDWAFMVKLAQRVGWTFYADNTEVHFRDPLSGFRDQLETASSFTAFDQAQSMSSNYSRAILSFHAVSGASTPDGGQLADRRLLGIDPRTGENYVASNAAGELSTQVLGRQVTAPPFTSYEQHPATGLGEAIALLQGQTMANRWHIQAKAEVRGNARVRPGMLIALLGLGERHSGFWYVQAAEHELGAQDYVLHLTLGRDSEWSRYPAPPLRVRRVTRVRTDPYGSRIDHTPPSILVNDTWRAAYSPRANSAG